MFPDDVIISSATVPVTIYLIQVISSKGICFKAAFPSTVELPQQNDANNANNEAHITAADGKTLVNIARISFFEKQLQLEFQACPDVPKLESISRPIDLAAYSHI